LIKLTTLLLQKTFYWCQKGVEIVVYAA